MRMLTLVLLGGALGCVPADADGGNPDPCESFYAALEAVPHDTLVRTTGEIEWIWNRVPVRGCQVRFVTHDALVAGHDVRHRPHARRLFDTFHAALAQIAVPVRLSIATTRIGFIGSVTFAAVMPRIHSLRAHILLERQVDSPRFHRIDAGPPYWVHHFTITSPADIDEEMREWLAGACRVGGMPPANTARDTIRRSTS